MLQYFFKKNPPLIKQLKYTPQLEYFCKLTPEDNFLRRILHKHANICEIIFIYQGEGNYFVHDRVYPVAQGDIIICNANTLHEEFLETKKTLGSFCLGISNLQLDHLPKNHFISEETSPVISAKDSYNCLYDLCQVIYTELNYTTPPNREYCTYILQGILTKILALNSQKKLDNNNIDNKLIFDTKIYIENNFSDNLNLTSIADAMKVNKFHISHLFKKQLGYSIHQYIIKLRIGEAQNLLINTELNITDIALKVGYNNSNYFQNVFREYIGIPPRRYRKFWRGEKIEST